MAKTLWLGRLSISFGITGRGKNGSNPPWLGFYYGSWFPRIWWNGGNPWRNEVIDFGWYWLCFHGSWTLWGKKCGNWFWSFIKQKD